MSGTSLLPTKFSISLQTQNTATLDSTDFPSAIDVADFSSKRWSISFDDDGQRVDVSGNLTSVEISAVPLPAGLPMLIAGLCAFGLVRRRL